MVSKIKENWACSLSSTHLVGFIQGNNPPVRAAVLEEERKADIEQRTGVVLGHEGATEVDNGKTTRIEFPDRELLLCFGLVFLLTIALVLFLNNQERFKKLQPHLQRLFLSR